MSHEEPDDIDFATQTAEDGPLSEALRTFAFRPFLFVVLECDRVSAGGARYALHDVDEVVIGRGGSRTAVLTPGRPRQLDLRIPNAAMSTLHARIRRAGSQWTIEDAGSTNGSYLNGEKVSSATLSDGDCIELGHTLFALRTGLPTPPDTPAVFDSLAARARHPALTTLLPTLASSYAELARLAPSAVPITITGRTGTGKEVIARAVHALSGRHGDLVAVNCGALAPNLVESQLFGHVRGSFSGAIRDEIGLVRAAHEGTLFLDEIGEMPKPAQVALLRVLQEREVVPVGATRPIKTDLRVIAASQEPLSELVEQGDLRADLQGRLDGYTVNLARLAERSVDLGIILAALVAAAGTDPPTLRGSVGRLLFRYPWPLNVRELEQTLRRATALAADRPISVSHLPDSIAQQATAGPGAPRPRGSSQPAPPTDELLRQELVQRLTKHDGNVTEVANEMGKARMQIHRWLRRLEIDPASFRK